MRPTKGSMRMGSMRRIRPPARPKLLAPIPTGPDTAQVVETLRARVEELEGRLAALESVLSVEGADVVVNATGSVLIQAGATVEISASTIRTAAALVEENTALSKVSGIVQCDTLIATHVQGTSYSPGAGNLW